MKKPKTMHAPTAGGLALCGQKNRTGIVTLRVPSDRPLEAVSCLKCLRERERQDTLARGKR